MTAYGTSGKGSARARGKMKGPAQGKMKMEGKMKGLAQGKEGPKGGVAPIPLRKALGGQDDDGGQDEENDDGYESGPGVQSDHSLDSETLEGLAGRQYG